MIKRELGIYLIARVSVLLVFMTYFGRTKYQVIEAKIAKETGLFIETLLNRYTNGFWTFGHKSSAPYHAWRFVILHPSTLGTNVFINAPSLKLLAGTSTAFQLAFALGRGFAASLSFLGMMFFAFKPVPTLEHK